MEINQALEHLKTMVGYWNPPLDEASWEAFSQIWRLDTAKRKTILTEAGTVEKYFYFILKGTQRVYYLDDKGREATIVFSYPPSFGGVLDAFMLQNTSRYFYETLTASTFLKTSYPQMNAVMQQFPLIREAVHNGVLQAFQGMIMRLVEVQCYTAEDRFRALLKRSPHVLQWVPQKYLANYLGIDPTNFSKFMNRIKI